MVAVPLILWMALDWWHLSVLREKARLKLPKFQAKSNKTDA